MTTFNTFTCAEECASQATGHTGAFSDLHALIGLVQPHLIILSSSSGVRRVSGGIIDSTVHGERSAHAHQQINRDSSPQHIVGEGASLPHALHARRLLGTGRMR